MAVSVEWAVPFDSRVSAQKDIALEISAKFFEKTVWGSTFPQELVDTSRRAVAHQEAEPPELEPPVGWQRAEPRLVLVGGLPVRVFVAQPGKVIVARVRIATLAMIEVG